MPIALTLFVSLLVAFMSEESVLFIVGAHHDESGWYAEPIVAINGGKLRGIVNPSDTSFAPYKKFTAEYFRIGRQYPVFRNDKRLGVMTVTEPDSFFACMQIIAGVNVTLGGQEKITSDEPALAYADAKLRKIFATASTTPRDSAQAVHLAQKEFTAKKVAKAAVKKLQLNRIRSVDLDGDGSFEQIATFETTQSVYSKQLKMDMMMIYFLTIVIDEEKVIYSFYTSGAEEGDEQGNFASRQDIAGITDVDMDGVAEIVFRNFYYEAWDYTIVGRTAGQWKQRWQGGGGGC